MLSLDGGRRVADGAASVPINFGLLGLTGALLLKATRACTLRLRCEDPPTLAAGKRHRDRRASRRLQMLTFAEFL